MPKVFKQCVVIFTVVAAVYFANKSLHSYWGKQALSRLSITVYSVDEAMRRASKEEKLVLADYSAIWCPSCRKLDTNVFANRDISEQINRDFVYARVEYDSNEGIAFAKRYDVVGFPRVLVLLPTGESVAELPLTFDPQEYSRNLDIVSASFSLK